MFFYLQDSCSSCSEESEEVETTQNIENVQKTNLKNLHVEFDHLSVVPEENSGENSDKNSTQGEKDILKADQSYPTTYDNLNKMSTLPITDRMPKHFFSPIIKHNEQNNSNQTLYPHQHYSDVYTTTNPCKFTTFKPFQTPEYVNLPPLAQQTDKIINTTPNYNGISRENLQEVQLMNKNGTDLIVKMDNYKFTNTNSQSTFSNGGNLEELLNDIECISQDILKLSNSQLSTAGDNDKETTSEKPYKSELNVVLMPTPMPLIGFEKYKNLSNENLNHTKSAESLSISNQNLRVIPENMEHNFMSSGYHESLHPFRPLTPNISPATSVLPTPGNEMNPFFFGNFPTPHSDYFNTRYNPDSFLNNNENIQMEKQQQKLQKSEKEICNSKCNLLDLTSSEHVSSENEENLKFKTTQNECIKTDVKYENNANAIKGDSTIKNDNIIKIDHTIRNGNIIKNDNTIKDNTMRSDNTIRSDNVMRSDNAMRSDTMKTDTMRSDNTIKSDNKKNESKPKLSIRRKVSIHFKGKKEKNKLKAEKLAEQKNEEKKKMLLLKTPSMESKKSTIELLSDPKTPTSSDKKSSSVTEQRSSTSDKNTSDKEKTSGSSKDKKQRKSSSVSPDRKHVHVKDEKKSHKKHKRLERQRSRRSVNSNDRFHRERSFSVCTDRSNILDHRLGLGLSSFPMYDDYSDRDRSNSLSSCDTVHRRKMSSISQFPVNGKIPWCGCWGNGCL